MTPQQIEMTRNQLIQQIFAAAEQGDKLKLRQCVLKKYAQSEVMTKENPNSASGVSRVRRKTIKMFIEDFGEILNREGKTVFDILIEKEFYLMVVGLMQDEAFGLLATHSFDKNKRCFKVKIQPSNFYKIVTAIHKELSAQDFQRRAFIRRLCYGQPINDEVDEFLSDHYESISEELMQFRQKYGGRQV